MQEEIGSEDSLWQDPSWHIESDESDTSNTTASTPRESAQYAYEGTRVGEAQKIPSSHSVEPAIETTLYAGCKDGTTLRPRASKLARDGWRWQAGQTEDDGLRGKGHRWSSDGLAPEFGSRLRMEELRRLRETAEGKSQSASLIHAEKSSIPAPSIEIPRVAHSQCTSTALTATAVDTIPTHSDHRVPDLLPTARRLHGR